MRTDAPASKIRRGLPVAALLFGLIGLLELGWVWMENIKASPCGKPRTEHYYSNPSLLGIMLSLTAIIKDNLNTPVSSGEDVRAAIRAGGKRLAILGVITSAPGLLITIASLPSFSIYLTHHCRESAPTQTLRTIHNSQAQFQAAKQRVGTLKELNEAGQIDSSYANGSSVYGYIYSSSNTTAETYCVHADRANDKCGSRDFIVCEDGIIRFIESETKGTVRRGEGQPIGASY
jgi:hypothetical protein